MSIILKSRILDYTEASREPEKKNQNFFCFDHISRTNMASYQPTTSLLEAESYSKRDGKNIIQQRIQCLLMHSDQTRYHTAAFETAPIDKND